MNRLYGLSYSAWTERARWCLDFHQIPYQYEEYLPMLGELPLRWQLEKWHGKLSVPVFQTDKGFSEGSLAIAIAAEQQKTGRTLFAGKNQQIIQFVGRLEPFMAEARLRSTLKLRDDIPALMELVPDFIPEVVKPIGLPLSLTGVLFILSKYSLTNFDVKASRQKAMVFLQEMEEQLQADDYVLGEFSFADICLASYFQFIQPVSDNYIAFGSHIKRAWTDTEFAEKFSSLIAWRDRLFQQRR